MVEYRQLREKYSILQLIKTPELACEVTLQPMNAFDLDAAIIFADILPPLEGMGLELDFVKGEGPAIYNPVRTADDVARLHGRLSTDAACRSSASAARPSRWRLTQWKVGAVPIISRSKG